MQETCRDGICPQSELFRRYGRHRYRVEDIGFAGLAGLRRMSLACQCESIAYEGYFLSCHALCHYVEHVFRPGLDDFVVICLHNGILNLKVRNYLSKNERQGGK